MARSQVLEFDPFREESMSFYRPWLGVKNGSLKNPSRVFPGSFYLLLVTLSRLVIETDDCAGVLLIGICLRDMFPKPHFAKQKNIFFSATLNLTTNPCRCPRVDQNWELSSVKTEENLPGMEGSCCESMLATILINLFGSRLENPSLWPPSPFFPSYFALVLSKYKSGEVTWHAFRE